MLTALVLKLVAGICMAGLALFPTWKMPTGTPSAAALGAANLVLPLDIWATLMGLTVAAMGAGLMVWVIKMCVNFVRGSGA